MVERIAHYLTGWVEFQISGSGPRFLNAAAKTGIEFWGFRREGEHTILRGTPSDYKRLRPLFRRCGVRSKIRQKRGFPFLRARIWKHKGMVLGALGGTAIYVFLSGFCWGVTVTGTEVLTKTHVLETAAEKGVFVGASLRDLDPKEAALAIQNALPEATWLSVNTDGCFVEVALQEALPAPEVVDDREWSNIVASRAGTVISVEAERGRPEVKLGETVEAGQLLIAGLYQQEVDPYSPVPEELYQILGAARGSVRALTYREFTVEVPREQVELVPTGKRRESYSLVIFGVRIPLGLYSVPEGEYRTWTETESWNPLGQTLPLSWETTTYEPLKEETQILEEEAWKEAALLELRRVQREELPQDSQVVEETLSYQFKGNVCVLTAKCRCQEEIGVVKKISFE
jgi:similar to stage IV sporulation protein